MTRSQTVHDRFCASFVPSAGTRSEDFGQVPKRLADRIDEAVSNETCIVADGELRPLSSRDCGRMFHIGFCTF